MTRPTIWVYVIPLIFLVSVLVSLAFLVSFRLVSV